jgi:dihydrofolate reductase
MMAKLIYSAIASADGYIEDPGGSIDWGVPDEELLGFINELERPARTCLYGRRMYEAMLYWETAHTTVQPRLFQEFTGIWQAAEKIVFSKTLASVSSARTRVEPAFEPGLVRQLKSAAEHDNEGRGRGPGYWIRSGSPAVLSTSVLPPVSLSDGADLGDPGLEHPARAGRVTCPRDWRAAAGWETATGPAPGHAQPGRSGRRLTPASGKGPGSA